MVIYRSQKRYRCENIIPICQLGCFGITLNEYLTYGFEDINTRKQTKNPQLPPPPQTIKNPNYLVSHQNVSRERKLAFSSGQGSCGNQRKETKKKKKLDLTLFHGKRRSVKEHLKFRPLVNHVIHITKMTKRRKLPCTIWMAV